MLFFRNFLFHSLKFARPRPPHIQAHMGTGIHGLPKVSPGHAMPDPSTPCGQATPETTLRLFQGWQNRRAGGLRPCSSPLPTPSRTGLPIFHVLRVAITWPARGGRPYGLFWSFVMKFSNKSETPTRCVLSWGETIWGSTDGQTDQRANRPTNEVSYRGARTRLKMFLWVLAQSHLLQSVKKTILNWNS
jgi:hypothetical protein